MAAMSMKRISSWHNQQVDGRAQMQRLFLSEKGKFQLCEYQGDASFSRDLTIDEAHDCEIAHWDGKRY